MRHSNTGKSDSQEPANEKRGFFAAAGERLKRVMSGRPEPAASSAVAEVSAPSDGAAEPEVSTSVQARARELLLQDRTHGADSKQGASKSSPPPLPSQRTAAAGGVETKLDGHATSELAESAELLATGVSVLLERTGQPRRAPLKRPVRDSKSVALRARLGAAKAALAQAQAKRAAECEAAEQHTDNTQQPAAQSRVALEITQREIPLELAQQSAPFPQPFAAQVAELVLVQEATEVERLEADADDSAEPIRTLTIARLLARQGYRERSLSIYDELLLTAPSDSELRAEAERVRAQKDGEH